MTVAPCLSRANDRGFHRFAPGQDAKHLAVLLAFLSSFAIGRGVEQGGGAEPGGNHEAPPSSEGNGGGTSASARPGAITWCSTSLNRTATVAGTSLDYPSKPYTTSFNTSLEEVALSALDKEMMKEAGLDPEDNADVTRFTYFIRGFDFRLILGDTPSSGN